MINPFNEFPATTLENLGKGHAFSWKKDYLSYDKSHQKWSIISLNFFERIGRKVFGLYRETHLKNVVKRLCVTPHLPNPLADRIDALMQKTYPKIRYSFQPASQENSSISEESSLSEESNTSKKSAKSEKNSNPPKERVEIDEQIPPKENFFGNKPKNETITTVKTVLEEVDKHPQIVSKIHHLKNTFDFFTIRVLDQYNGTVNGERRCGVHALKNALLGLCNEFRADLFTDKDFYKMIEEFVENASGLREGQDASIAHLMTALQDLQEPTRNQAFKSYLSLDQTNHTISMFNGEAGEYFNGSDGSLYGATGGVLSLYSLANLVELSQNKGPKKHAFLFGMDGHWVTLIYQRDEKGKVTWFACDSGDGGKKRLNVGANLLMNALSQAKEFAETNYYEAAGEIIHQLAQLLDSSGNIIDQGKKGGLLKNAMGNLQIIEEAFKFMQRLGWLTFQANLSEAVQVYVQDLKKVATFYYSHGIISRDGSWVDIRNTFNIARATWESSDHVAQRLSINLLKSFRELKGAHIVSTVSQAKIHCYNLDNFKDYGWGCAWRSMVITLSTMGLDDEPIEKIFERYHDDVNLLHKLTSQVDSEIFKNPDNVFYLEKTLPSYHLNWTEPFMGQLYLAEKGVKSSLEYYKNFPTNMQTPQFMFKNPKIGDFSALCSKLVFHFAKQKAGVMIDDSYYSYAILGINVGTDQVDLLIADPHTNKPEDAVYTVSLDLEGRFLRCSLEGDKDQFADSPTKIDFRNKSWMMLFPEPKN